MVPNILLQISVFENVVLIDCLVCIFPDPECVHLGVDQVQSLCVVLS